MSQQLVPSNSSSSLTAGRSRTTSRQITALDRAREVGLARIETRAQLEAAKAHAVGYIGQQAMQAVAMVSQTEQQLATMCPLAVTRLQAIADVTSMAIADVVMNARRHLG